MHVRKHPKILTMQVRHSSSVKPEVVLICISTCLIAQYNYPSYPGQGLHALDTQSPSRNYWAHTHGRSVRYV